MRPLLAAPLALCLLLGSAHGFAAPMGPEFTYQGSLKEAGSPATGTYDFRFRLFPQAVGGVQTGPDVLSDDIAVTDGIFTTTLDFGAAPLNGTALFLEIEVRAGSSAGAYTLLTPRQSLTAAPVAQYALSGGTQYWTPVAGGIRNATDGFVGVNRATRISSAEQFGVHSPATSGYGGMYVSTAGAGQPFVGYSAPGVTSWTYLDAPSGKWHLHHGGAERITCTAAGNVGIGELAPTSKLEVRTASAHGVEATTTAASSFGVYGTGTAAGVRGVSGAAGGAGVRGENPATGGFGVRGDATGPSGFGVAGYSTSGTSVYGSTGTGFGVYGTNGGSNVNGYAGYFNGRVHVAGTLSKLSGSFRIDHPLDPANKTLSHSFVESPDMMNLYNGNVTTDSDGRAVVEMPDYFDALNRDFRYQLTPIGAFAQVMVEREMDHRRFVIRTDQPHVRVSWQVTGIRQDAYAKAHPVIVEESKSAAERGTYLFPAGFAGPAPARRGDAGGR